MKYLKKFEHTSQEDISTINDLFIDLLDDGVFIRFDRVSYKDSIHVEFSRRGKWNGLLKSDIIRIMNSCKRLESFSYKVERFQLEMSDEIGYTNSNFKIDELEGLQDFLDSFSFASTSDDSDALNNEFIVECIIKKV